MFGTPETPVNSECSHLCVSEALWGLRPTRAVVTESFLGAVPFPTSLAHTQFSDQKGGTGMHMFQYVSFLMHLFLACFCG